MSHLYSARFVLILALQFTFGLGFSSFLLLPKYLAEVHGADATSIGRVAAAGPVAAVMVMPLLAFTIDRFRRHRLMLASALMMLTAALGFAFTSSFGPGLYALRMLQGAAFASFMAAAATLVVEVVPKERLGQAIGLSGASNLITNAIGPGVAEPLALAWGWRSVFLLSALCSGLAAIGTSVLRDTRRAELRQASLPRLAEPRRLGLFHSALVSGLGFGTVVTFYQPLALELGMSHVGSLFIGYTAAALGVRVAFGAWLDRFDRRSLVLLSTVVYTLVVLATAGLRPGWLFPLGVALGLAQGTLYPVSNALLFELAEPQHRGALMTYFSGSFNLGIVIATLGLGALAGHIGYRPVFVVASALTFTALPVLARTLKKPGTHATPGAIGLDSRPP
ncbi:MAG TPA: MFS transporter [Polyangiaceae bacterium]|nr:MFS transporter [Polyangiaceae bacterium]